MTRCTWSICRVLICGLLGCCLTAPALALRAGEKAQTQAAQGEPAMDPMMAEMMKYANPGPEHEVLKSLAGSWKTVTKAWFGPGEPQVTEGTAEATSILGGRFLREEYTGIFMGDPFQGMGVTGYDLMKKEYVGTWVDSMGTGIAESKGRYDAAAKRFDYTATYMDPMTMKEKTWRMVNKIIDNNKHVFSMFDMMDGKEVMTMEITYTRK